MTVVTNGSIVTRAAADATSAPSERDRATTISDHGRASAWGVRGGCRRMCVSTS
jgi:hypothetical protein